MRHNTGGTLESGKISLRILLYTGCQAEPPLSARQDAP